MLQTACRHIASNVTGNFTCYVTEMLSAASLALQPHNHVVKSPVTVSLVRRKKEKKKKIEEKFTLFSDQNGTSQGGSLELCETKCRVQALLNHPALCHLVCNASVCIFAVVAGTVKCADASSLLAAVSSLTDSSLVEVSVTEWRIFT